jgi:hypothetical protein
MSGVGDDVGAVTDRVDEALQNAEGTFRSPRMAEDGDTSTVEGDVHWKPAKSLWISGMTLAALVGAPLTFTWGALALFLSTTAVTVCLGHSLGMHRRLIHRAYDCPLWLEWLFVYLGTLVGMAGPFGMIRQHDIRDWAQRKARCHPYLAHRSGLLRDGLWQLHCELRLAHPPQLVVERRVAEDRFYRFLELTWMAQQLPWAVLFFLLGGVPWVMWGIGVRVAASVTGHWLVGTSRTTAAAARGTSMAPACRATTCPGAASSRWERPCTTTTMPSRPRPALASARARWTPAGGCCVLCWPSAWCGTPGRPTPCRTGPIWWHSTDSRSGGLAGPCRMRSRAVLADLNES